MFRSDGRWKCIDVLNDDMHQWEIHSSLRSTFFVSSLYFFLFGKCVLLFTDWFEKWKLNERFSSMHRRVLASHLFLSHSPSMILTQQMGMQRITFFSSSCSLLDEAEWLNESLHNRSTWKPIQILTIMMIKIFLSLLLVFTTSITADEHDHRVGVTSDAVRCHSLFSSTKTEVKLFSGWIRSVPITIDRRPTITIRCRSVGERKRKSRIIMKPSEKTFSAWNWNTAEQRWISNVGLTFWPFFSSLGDVSRSGDKKKSEICEVTMTPESFDAFTYAIKNHYWYQMFIDDLPIWGSSSCFARVSCSYLFPRLRQAFSVKWMRPASLLTSGRTNASKSGTTAIASSMSI